MKCPAGLLNFMHDFFDKGYVSAYIGNGKGKTTASIGQVVRAAGNGLHCRIIQFMKTGTSGEIDFLRESPLIAAQSYGTGDFFIPGKSDILKHRKYCFEALADASNYGADLMVLDEILDAVSFGLVTEDELTELILNKPEKMELIITGRELSAKIDPLCGLISEIQCVRHYYDSGVNARQGIEF